MKEEEKIYTKADWKGSFSEDVPVGALVDEGIYTDFLESLPPISWKGNYFQNSEPYSHRLDEESGKWRATYSTFDGTDRKGVYRYLGTCFLNERIHRP